MADGVGHVLDVIAGGGPAAVVAAICWVGLVGVVVARQLPRLAPLVAAARGVAGTAEPAGRPHDNDPDYDTPLGALRLVAAGSRQPCIATDLTGRIEVFNQAAEALTGYTTEEMMGASITLLMGAGDAKAHRRHVAAYLADHAAGHRPRLMGQSREVALCQRDGTTIRVRVDLSHVNNGWQGLWAWLRPMAPPAG